MYHIGQILPIEAKRDILGEDMPAAWYALQVPRQKENAVREMLKARGIHCCYPERDKTWRIRGKTQKRQYPIIPGVVYVKFTQRPHWDVLKARKLITGVYSYGDRPIELPGDVISAVMGLPTEAEKLEAARLELLRIKEGERATVAGGPLQGFVVDVLKVRDGRVWFETLTGIKGEAPETALRKA
jgi:transcriptional antiterminator NusG